MLDDKQLETVKEALNGKRNLLALCYNITRQIPVVLESVKHMDTSEAAHENKQGSSWTSTSNHTITSTSRETVLHTEKISAMLDAADWPSILKK